MTTTGTVGGHSGRDAAGRTLRGDGTATFRQARKSNAEMMRPTTGVRESAITHRARDTARSIIERAPKVAVARKPGHGEPPGRPVRSEMPDPNALSTEAAVKMVEGKEPGTDTRVSGRSSGASSRRSPKEGRRWSAL